TGGSGTQSDPYIIEGWEIDANGGSYGIWIENTTAYFVIRNCNVYGATDWWNLPGGAGITLNNVTHGTLDSNKCNNSLCGIYLYRSSQYNNITNNNASGNSDIGIYLASSSNNNITNNNASGNKYGIYLWNSSNNNITNNNASGNSWAGIRLSSSSNNNITNNNASGNSDTGIYLWDSSNNNNITNNNASGNSWDGIRLWWSSTNNTITNNNASGNRYGIYLWNSSNNNNITYNWICNNANYGVYITGSTGNTIHHNNFIANNGAGKGVSGNCQAYDSVGGNYWYDNSVNEGNYWSNWDSNGNGTANAYPIDGGAGASDWYPLGNPVAEFSSMPLFVLALASLLILARVRKPRKHS
ncbi:MAG: NosD domain-containing protein, partial [Thermoplasmata archaeon]